MVSYKYPFENKNCYILVKYICTWLSGHVLGLLRVDCGEDIYDQIPSKVFGLIYKGIKGTINECGDPLRWWLWGGNYNQ